jgi:hypothetical protein
VFDIHAEDDGLRKAVAAFEKFGDLLGNKAAAILNEIPSERRKFTDEDVGRLALFGEALDHYQTRSPRDVAPQLWREAVGGRIAASK